MTKRYSDTDNQLANARAYVETLNAPPKDGPRTAVEGMIIGGLKDAIEQCADAIDKADHHRQAFADATLATEIQRQIVSEAIQHLQGLAHVRTATAAASKAAAAKAAEPPPAEKPAEPVEIRQNPAESAETPPANT